MRLAAPTLAFAAILAFVPSIPGGAAPDPAAETTEAAIRALLDAQVAAWNRGDLEGFMIGYWNSPDLVFQAGAETTRGWQATLDRYRKRYSGEGREMGRLEFTGVEVQVLGPESAFARGGWRLAMKDGSRPGGLFTLVLKRLGSDWRIVHDHTS
jgi:ketosteroid isomerase-like protein